MTWHAFFLAEIKRRLLAEGIPRTLTCLDLLDESDIWFRPNEQSNSVGNLVLHLCGNARQWILAGMRGQPDRRQRAREFEEQGPLPTSELRTMVLQLSGELEEALNLLQPEDLEATYTVQGFEESGIGILIHVVEHYSYHLGQITYVVKAHTSQDTGYYSGLDLDATG